MTCEIRDCTLADLRAIAPRLRQAEIAEIALQGDKPRHFLNAMWRDSEIRKVALVDGEIAAAFGCRAQLLSMEADAWLVTTPAVERVPLTFYRTARACLGDMLEGRKAVTSRIWGDQPQATRMMKMLGFEVLPPDSWGDAHRLRLERVEDRHIGRPPFIVFGLPRSRTFWLSRFLSYGRWTAHHDLPVICNRMQDLAAVLRRPNTGTVETGLSRAAPWLREILPDARIAVIRRSPAAVHASAAAKGWEVPLAYLEAEDARLAAIASRPGVLSVDFDAMDEAACKRLFEHCLGRPFDADWYRRMAPQNIQLDLDERRREIDKDALEALFHEIGAHITIERESFASLYRDGQTLFAEHFQETRAGEAEPFDPDVDLARALEAEGRLVAIAARCPALGMLGYLVSLVTPSLERRGHLDAHQNIFFVTKGLRGRLGIQLHAAMRAELKRLGVHKLIMRAGVRGSGPKQAALFERLGATHIGGLYSLSLEA